MAPNVRVAKPDRIPTTSAELNALTVIEKVEQLPKTPFKLVSFGIMGEQATDAEMTRFAKLSSLQVVYMLDTPITDEGLKSLATCRGLVVLNLAGMKNITDRGVKHIAGLVKLQSLVLGNSQVTDNGLAPLSELTDLEPIRITLS
jgi:hypothetical protein